MKKSFFVLLLIILILSLGACSRAENTPPGDNPSDASQETQAQDTAPQAGAKEPVGEGDPDPTSTSAPTDTPGPTATPTEIVPYVQTVGSFVAIHEIGLGPQGYVSLTNFTSVPVTTKGLFLCQGEACFELPDAVIEAGETGRVAVGDGAGIENVIVTNAAIGELKPSDGEVALFASDKFDDPQAMLVYLQWGSTPHLLTDLAVEAGLWIATGYAPTTENATRLFRVEESGWWLFEEAKP